MEPNQPSWMIPFFDYLLNGILPNDGVEARRISGINIIRSFDERGIGKNPSNKEHRKTRCGQAGTKPTKLDDTILKLLIKWHPTRWRSRGKEDKNKSGQYTIRGGILYRKSYLALWLKCVMQKEGMSILQETHVGEAGAHKGARSPAGKIFRLGIYWPDIYKEAIKITRRSKECQMFM